MIVLAWIAFAVLLSLSALAGWRLLRQRGALADMKLAGPVDMLRSNFIGGVKHMPVTFTPGAKKNPGPVELKGTLVYDK